jgi:hypothetical protein
MSGLSIFQQFHYLYVCFVDLLTNFLNLYVCFQYTSKNQKDQYLILKNWYVCFGGQASIKITPGRNLPDRRFTVIISGYDAPAYSALA